MYWHELNEKRIAQLRSWLRNKRLIIVGNSVKLLEDDYGDLIDSYDVVVRIGKGLPDITRWAMIGQKTDIWFTGMLRAGLYTQVDCAWKIITPSTNSTYDDKTPFIPINKVLFNPDFQPYRDYIWSDSIEGTKIYWRACGFNKETRPSQGIICSDFFARRVGHKNIDIIGFDFFTESKTVNGIDYKSWHFPIKSGPEIPHKSDFERNVIVRLSNDYGLRLLPYNN